MWRWADLREDVREDVKMSRCERRCEDEQMWRWADVREDVKMSRWEKTDVREDVKMSRCEDEQMWEKMWRWADVKEKCEDEKMLRRCEDEKMFYRPPLLEEPCAQTLSGKTPKIAILEEMSSGTMWPTSQLATQPASHAARVISSAPHKRLYANNSCFRPLRHRPEGRQNAEGCWILCI